RSRPASRCGRDSIRSTLQWPPPSPSTTVLGWPAMADLDSLRTEAEAAIAAASSSAELEDLRVRYLGRKAELTQTLRSIGELPPEQRGPVGKQANEARVALESLLEERTRELADAELERRLIDDRVDVTLPGDPPE